MSHAEWNIQIVKLLFIILFLLLYHLINLASNFDVWQAILNTSLDQGLSHHLIHVVPIPGINYREDVRIFSD